MEDAGTILLIIIDGLVVVMSRISVPGS